MPDKEISHPGLVFFGSKTWKNVWKKLLSSLLGKLNYFRNIRNKKYSGRYITMLAWCLQFQGIFFFHIIFIRSCWYKFWYRNLQMLPRRSTCFFLHLQVSKTYLVEIFAKLFTIIKFCCRLHLIRCYRLHKLRFFRAISRIRI